MIQSADEYWDIVRNDIYPQGKTAFQLFSTVCLYHNMKRTGKYVYISPATSFLKGRVKGHWYRGKEVGDSSMSQYHDVFQVISGRFQYVGHVTNKMWPLSEEYTNHLVRMQQVHVHKIHIIKILSLTLDFWVFQTAYFEK